jgi:hypothetical protein
MKEIIQGKLRAAKMTSSFSTTYGQDDQTAPQLLNAS